MQHFAWYRFNLLQVKQQACREKNSGWGSLRVYQQMLANLVSWLRGSFNWNCFNCPEILTLLCLNVGESKGRGGGGEKL